jgi:WD repeat and SOF domain-containing protein 1
MKVHAITRNPDDYVRETPQDVFKVSRNLDPSVHPFEKAREYTRALNAVKLQKVFAKPFIAALDGHADGVYRLARHPRSLATLASGACDGEIKVWNLSGRKAQLSVPRAHEGFVRGLTISLDGLLLSAGDDRTVKIWNIDEADRRRPEPLRTFLGKNAFSDIDHQRGRPLFATSGVAVEVWDHDRAEPVHTFSWGSDSTVTVKFNPAEADVFASTATDRNIVLYDLRGATPVRKLVMTMRTNALCWNPMEPFNFTTASEDHNCYTFDMRKLDRALCVHQDHVSAVLDVDYSPTGREFVTGSYDRTLRIFAASEGHSREIYHTKRMQRIFSVRFSGDSEYVLSGSDDTNIRIWKTHASKPLKLMHPREEQKLEYSQALVERYKHLPEIRRIHRHRQIPKAVFQALKVRMEMKKASKKREENRRKHSKKAAEEPRLVERKRHVVEVVQ